MLAGGSGYCKRRHVFTKLDVPLANPRARRYVVVTGLAGGPPIAERDRANAVITSGPVISRISGDGRPRNRFRSRRIRIGASVRVHTRYIRTYRLARA